MIKTIIVQAGGQGTRLGSLTQNKPKALVSVFGEPLLIRLMRQYPSSKFIVIADYKREVLADYLREFAPARYQIVSARGRGTCSGLNDALGLVGAKTPFAIVWCDLYFESGFLPAKLDRHPIQIGLSKTFRCRWSFRRGRLEEKPSSQAGIAGVYLFAHRGLLRDLPESGEFCAYLQSRQHSVSIAGYDLRETYEIGTLESYQRITEGQMTSRYFNQIRAQTDRIIKVARDQKARQLQKAEADWYRLLKHERFDFVPKVLRSTPLTLERLWGRPLDDLSLQQKDRQNALCKLVNALSQIHTSKEVRPGDPHVCVEAVIVKAFDRLQEIKGVIPFAHKKYFLCNGKRIRNFLHFWPLIEHEMRHYLAKHFVVIHGDPTFSNTLYDKSRRKIYLFDPRGTFGSSKYFGDADYDWAKVYYSLVGGYDAFNRRQFDVSIAKARVQYSLPLTQGRELETEFFALTQAHPSKIKFFHALLWLSVTSYVVDDWDSVVLAFARGMELMEHYFDERGL